MDVVERGIVGVVAGRLRQLHERLAGRMEHLRNLEDDAWQDNSTAQGEDDVGFYDAEDISPPFVADALEEKELEIRAVNSRQVEEPEHTVAQVLDEIVDRIAGPASRPEQINRAQPPQQQQQQQQSETQRRAQTMEPQSHTQAYTRVRPPLSPPPRSSRVRNAHPSQNQPPPKPPNRRPTRRKRRCP